MEVRVFSWALFYMINLCPCHSGKSYSDCCEPLHKGTPAENALKLMRSRYSAYALNKPDYIIKTTHPSNHDLSRESIIEFSQSTKFEQLVIHDFQESGNEATVTFTAYLSQDGHDATFTEKSYFKKVNGVWLYASRA